MTKAEKTKQFIIEQAAPLFNVKGIAATALSDVMEVTRMPKGSLYLHFESKDELAGSVVDYNLNSVLERIEKVAGAEKKIKDKLIAVFENLSNPAKATITGGCPMINFGMEADDTNPAIRKKVAKTAETIQNNIEAMIELGKKSGEFNRTWDSHVFAIKSFAMLEGAIVLSRITGNRDKMKVILTLVKEEIETNSR